jgi:fructose-specific component phosphotransferase system IIB-like protein
VKTMLFAQDAAITASGSDLLLTYVSRCPDKGAAQQLWIAALRNLAASAPARDASLASLVDAAAHDQIPSWVHAVEDVNLDDVAGTLLAAALDGKSAELGTLNKILSHPGTSSLSSPLR